MVTFAAPILLLEISIRIHVYIYIYRYTQRRRYALTFVSLYLYVKTGIAFDVISRKWYWSDGRPGPAPSEQDRHFVQQNRLLNYDKIHFQMGGTSNVAANETYTASQRKMIDMVCCVGPDTGMHFHLSSEYLCIYMYIY
jgi:hypothetical protein